MTDEKRIEGRGRPCYHYRDEQGRVWVLKEEEEMNVVAEKPAEHAAPKPKVVSRELVNKYHEKFRGAFIVDDETQKREALMGLLADLGYTVGEDSEAGEPRP